MRTTVRSLVTEEGEVGDSVKEKGEKAGSGLGSRLLRRVHLIWVGMFNGGVWGGPMAGDRCLVDQAQDILKKRKGEQKPLA